MNKGLQKHQLEKQLKDKGVDDFDTESHIDESLGLGENLDNLEDQLGMSLRDKKPRNAKGGRERQTKAELKQAKMRHESRSETAQLADESKKAETVFTGPLEDGQFEKWAENPNEFDVKGVDF